LLDFSRLFVRFLFSPVRLPASNQAGRRDPMSLTPEDRQWISELRQQDRQWILELRQEDRQWMSAQLSAQQEQNRQWTLEQLEKLETKLLTAFHRWAEPVT